MNTVFVVGIVNNDPKPFHNAETGTTTTMFTVRDAWKNGNGEWKDMLYNCRVFGKRGETIQQYFQRGKPIIIVGKETGRKSWTSQSGRTYEETQVDVYDFSFVPREQEVVGANGHAAAGEPNPDDLDV